MVSRITGALFLAVTLLLGLGQETYAHERWFVEQGGQHIGEGHWLDWPNVFIVMGGALLAALLVIADRSALSLKLQSVSDRLARVLPKGIEWRVVAFLAAVMLITNALTGVFLASDLLLPGLTADNTARIPRYVLAGNSPLPVSAATLGAAAQLLLGVLLLSQVSFLIPGVLILVVALPIAIIYFAPDLLADYVAEFIALALALIFFGMGASSLDRRLASWFRLDPGRYDQLPVPIIRVGVGLTLAILALHNKLLSPNMALTFLDTHYLNFMPYLGFESFTDIRFVFAAGVVELTLGILLILGIATRFVAAGVFALMITTAVILGSVDLVGHLPIIGIAALLLYRGSGGYRVAASAATMAAYKRSTRVTPGACAELFPAEGQRHRSNNPKGRVPRACTWVNVAMAI